MPDLPGFILPTVDDAPNVRDGVANPVPHQEALIKHISGTTGRELQTPSRISVAILTLSLVETIKHLCDYATLIAPTALALIYNLKGRSS